MKGSKLIPLLLVTAGLVMLMTGGLSVFAATTATQGLSFTNPVTSSITLTGTAIDFGSITPGIPVEQTSAATIAGESNARFTVTLTGTDFISGANTLNLNDVFQARLTNGTYAPVNSGMAVVNNHAAGTASAVMDYQLTVPSTAPGTSNAYSATLTYTISNS